MTSMNNVVLDRDGKYKCFWCLGSKKYEDLKLYADYHDTEWGIPVYDDDNKHFECITLEGAQAGLSWLTILRKREFYRRDFHGFDPLLVSQMTEDDVNELMDKNRYPNQTIVRHRGKILSTINNAKCFLKIQQEHGSFTEYIWNFFECPTPILVQSSNPSIDCTPYYTRLSKDLKYKGFKFVGPTTCESYMQAIGIIQQHEKECFRYKE